MQTIDDRMLASPSITLCVDARILAEYDEVLRRPRFHLEAGKVDLLMDHLRATAEVHPTLPLAGSLPDEDDEPFLAVALSSRASGLVTGTLKHYPAHSRQGVKVLTPGAFLELWRKRKTSEKDG